MRLTPRGARGLEVTFWQLAGDEAHGATGPRVLRGGLPAAWRPPRPRAETSEWARERLGYVQVELGAPSVGMTLDLLVATANHDGEGGLHGLWRWRRLDQATSRADTRLFPELGASYHEAVLGVWDDVVAAERAENAWVHPLETWLPVDGPPAGLDGQGG